MTTKQKVLTMIQKLPEDVGYDRLIESLVMMKELEVSLAQAERGEGMEHDAFFDLLQAEDAQSTDRAARV